MIKSAISSSVYFRLVTTTSIIAKLAVCAILFASISNARAAKNDGADAKDARRPAAHVTLKKPLAKNSGTKNSAVKNLTARKPDQSKADQSKLARLEREWKRLHSQRQVGLLNRLVVCRELGRCDGLRIHPTLGTALISVSPERPGLGAAAAAPAPEKDVTPAARGVYAAAKARKPVASARLRNKQPSPAARIRSAAAETDGSDMNAAGQPYGGALPVNP